MKALLRSSMIQRRNVLSKVEVECFSQRISASVLHWISRDSGLERSDSEARFSHSGTEISKSNLEKLNSEISAKESIRKEILVLSYMAVKHEVNLLPLMEKLVKRGVKIALPRVMNESRMEFFEVDPLDEKQFERSAYGIAEPKETLPLVEYSAFKKIYLLIPCVALNASLHRLGYGAGYYDRYFNRGFEEELKRMGVALVKLAPVYPFQKDADFVGDKHDIRADIVLDE